MTKRKIEQAGGGELADSAACSAEEPGPEKEEAKTKHFYTYILHCADGTYYTGWTTDLAKRLAAHNRGTASKYTRTRRPVRMVYWQEAGSRQEAMSREWHWKRLTRGEKERMIREGT